jgi:hypothetical protein
MQFLLGNLTEEERIAFEDRLFADDELFDRVQMAEADLVDGYVRGQLSPRDRERLEAGLLATPAGRDKLAFARALDARLHAVRPERRPAVATEPVSMWAWVVARRGWLAGAAAAAIAIAAVVYLVGAGDTVLTEPEPAVAESAPGLPAPSGPVPAPSETGPAALPPPADVEPRRGSLPPKNSLARTERARVVAFEFAPQTVRSVEELRVLSVPNDADTIRLVLGLDEPERSRYSAVLKTVAGEPVLRRDSLPVRGDGSGRRIVLDLPGDRLPPEEYVVALVEPDDETRVVADYIFRVERE